MTLAGIKNKICSVIRPLDVLLKEIQGSDAGRDVVHEEIPCHEMSDSRRLCKNPLVSVHMVTYNHEAWITEAIEGVVMQETDFEYELVIGEDGSIDRTREICFEYQKRYPDKIRVMWSEQNLGCRKNGLRCRIRERGEIIALCEGDDFWTDPKKLQKQVDLLRESRAVMSVAFNMIRNLDGKEVENVYAIKEFVDADDFFEHYFHTSTYIYWAKDYWRVLTTYPQIREWYDTVMCHCMVSLGRVALLPEIVSLRRVTGKGIATSLNSQESAILNLRQNLSLFLYGPKNNRRKFGLATLNGLNWLTYPFSDGFSYDYYKKYTRGWIFLQVYVRLFPSFTATYFLMRHVSYIVRRIWGR